MSPSPGDLTFIWTLDGRSCQDVFPNATYEPIRIVLDGPSSGESLEGGRYPCSDGRIDGVTLTDFAPGAYTFTIDALDLSGQQILFTTTGALRVNGPTVTEVSLNKVSAPASLKVLWKFGPDSQGCSEAGAIAGAQAISKMRVRLDERPPDVVDCADQDSGLEGTILEGLSAGTHQVKIEALVFAPIQGSASGQEQIWYRTSFSVNLTAGQMLEGPVTLDTVAAGATFKPALDLSGNPFDCAANGVETIWIVLRDSSDRCAKFPGSEECGFFAPCEGVASGGIPWAYLPAADAFDQNAQSWFGTWSATIQGWDVASTSHQVIYEGTAADLRVYAGRTADLQTFSVVMTEK
jgi:hypothetical protein